MPESGLANYMPMKKCRGKHTEICIPKRLIELFLEYIEQYVTEDRDHEVERIASLFGKKVASCENYKDCWLITHMLASKQTGLTDVVQEEDDNANESSLVQVEWNDNLKLTQIGWIHVSTFFYI